jgi:ribosomal protein L12E/L44/L45/RPP1/RPP2
VTDRLVAPEQVPTAPVAIAQKPAEAPKEAEQKKPAEEKKDDTKDKVA